MIFCFRRCFGDKNLLPIGLQWTKICPANPMQDGYILVQPIFDCFLVLWVFCRGFRGLLSVWGGVAGNPTLL